MEMEESKNNLAEKALTYGAKVGELSVGFTYKRLTDIGFDYFFYPFIIYKFGILKGGVVMTFLSFILCVLTIKFYDWSKRDWLGIEAVKGLRVYDGDKKIGRLTAWFMKKSEPVVFLFLTFYSDPFITTAYMRHGKFNGMSKRDWKIFMGSLLLGNAYWIFVCYTGITLFELGWKRIVG